MKYNRLIKTELERNENEKMVGELELENYKKRFAKEVQNTGFVYNAKLKPKTYPIPRKVRFQIWWNGFKNKLKILLGL